MMPNFWTTKTNVSKLVLTHKIALDTYYYPVAVLKAFFVNDVTCPFPNCILLYMC